MTVGGPTNASGVLLESAARTETTTTDHVTNHDARGVMLICDFTVQGASETLTPAVQTHDHASETWVTIHSAFTALSAIGTYVLVLFPAALSNLPASVGQGRNIVVPSHWRVVVTHSGAESHTYSLSYSLIA